MKFSFQTAARAAMALLFSVTAAQAAEIKVLSSNGVTAVTKEIGPEFERASGHRIAIRLDAAAILRKQIEAGEAFDLTILTAQTVAYTTEGTSGRYFVSVLERLGIGEQMKPKARTRALLKFLTAPAAMPVIKSKGMEPPG